MNTPEPVSTLDALVAGANSVPPPPPEAPKRCDHTQESCTHETVDFLGKRFAVAEKVGMMAIMRLAKAAKSGLDSSELEALAAMYDMLHQSIHPDDWALFELHADETHADDRDLEQVTQDVYTIITARPTRQAAASQPGQPTTSPRSTDDSFSRVIHRFESEGRADKALLVDNHRRAVEARQN